ncbi:unnamed protein product [Nesidiocoris tenuis]|uniref:Uncharacterized protein n=1 Tax=Nesidiocoris tenuis TaxID=355587 RepID=A0A6H5GRA0_9HEMI|nr:unnamed protein product [Nesidiocoris tenuis]
MKRRRLRQSSPQPSSPRATSSSERVHSQTIRLVSLLWCLETKMKFCLTQSGYRQEHLHPLADMREREKHRPTHIIINT